MYRNGLTTLKSAFGGLIIIIIFLK